MAQKMEYTEVTGQDETLQKIHIKPHAQGKELIFTDPETYSRHVFQPEGFTQSWKYKDEKNKHDFEAVREGNQIHIQGIFNGEPVQKTVDIDEKQWLNKLDHGLSQWAKSQENELVFWTLKLSSDLDPIKFRAKKLGTESISLPEGEYEAVKVKLTLDGFLLSQLWSAYCWYEVDSGLFLKYEGANGGPGTPTTTIELNKIASL
ncbi:hypothetical protein [Catalinimonas niigatensis]|uniref:hypothetical protein n=1 Tax=Catalinimonas niigatensis TaxID=1397264 RepID=UPI0026651464|nr:hypothetical protein [Catalinimonas niigatensis]WPP52216.1 hypothetical protein PZB72_07465 [Catalinimonas niigatensis]